MTRWTDSSTLIDAEVALRRLDDRGSFTIHHRLTLAIPVEGDIRPLESLPLEVRIDGVEAQNVRVVFEGVGMDMGEHRFHLDAVQGGEPGRFQGAGQLGICTSERMTWRARVSFDAPRGRLGSTFDLDVERTLP